MLKTKKLTLKKEKLRSLLDTELDKVAGGRVAGTSDCGWCSSGGVSKCYSSCNLNAGGPGCNMR